MSEPGFLSRRRALLVGAAFAATSRTGRTAVPGDSLLELVSAAYGHLQPVAAVRQHGRVRSHMRRIEGRIERLIVDDRRLRVEIDYPGRSRELRVLDGAQAWADGVTATPAMRLAMRIQAARLFMPELLLQRRHAFVDEGVHDTPLDEPLHMLRIELEPGAGLAIGVSPRTGRIRYSRGVVRLAGAEMPFVAVYDAFAPLHGRLVARREDQYAMGRFIGTTVIEGIDLLDAVPEGALAP